MSETTLPEGFRATVDSDNRRVWLHGVDAVVIAKAHPLTQVGWVVELINPDRVSVQVGVRIELLETLAASWCGMYAGAAVTA